MPISKITFLKKVTIFFKCGNLCERKRFINYSKPKSIKRSTSRNTILYSERDYNKTNHFFTDINTDINH